MRAFAKRIVSVILMSAMLIATCSFTSFAANTGTQVTSVTLSIDTSQITAGTYPDEINASTVPVYFVDATTSTGDAPGLRVLNIEVECISSYNRAFKIGDTPKIKIYFDVVGGVEGGVYYDYYVTTSTSVIVQRVDWSTGPTISSRSKARTSSQSMTSTLTLRALSGNYDPPQDLTWTAGDGSGNNVNGSLGQATWRAPETENCTGYYDIKLLRDGHSQYSLNGYNGTAFNFYPWMTKEGDYTFNVRSVGGTSGGHKSDWTESDGQYIDAQHISNGEGQGTGQGGSSPSVKVGWVKNGSTWTYVFPDGTLKKDGWQKVDGKWYLFGSSGAMLTGWQTWKNNVYYLDGTNGDMKTGWIKTADGKWYYLNTTEGDTYGAMLKNAWVTSNGKKYYMTTAGIMATGWYKLNNKFYYFNPTAGSDLGAMMHDTTIGTFRLGSDGAWVQN